MLLLTPLNLPLFGRYWYPKYLGMRTNIVVGTAEASPEELLILLVLLQNFLPVTFDTKYEFQVNLADAYRTILSTCLPLSAIGKGPNRRWCEQILLTFTTIAALTYSF